jgi:hypothetical protein
VRHRHLVPCSARSAAMLSAPSRWSSPQDLSTGRGRSGAARARRAGRAPSPRREAAGTTKALPADAGAARLDPAAVQLTRCDQRQADAERPPRERVRRPRPGEHGEDVRQLVRRECRCRRR